MRSLTEAPLVTPRSTSFAVTPNKYIVVLRLLLASTQAQVAFVLLRDTMDILHATDELPVSFRASPIEARLHDFFRTSAPGKVTQFNLDPNWHALGTPIVDAGSDHPTRFLVILNPKGSPFSENAVSHMQDVAQHLDSDTAPRAKHAVLPNREESLQVINQFIERTIGLPRRAVFSLIHLNLDHLSLINERYGWDTADLILAEMIKRIQNLLPEGGFLGSIGGGHFMIVTPPGTTAVTSRSLVQAILKVSAAPVSLDMGAIPFSLSAGWAVYPQDADTPNQLILAARAALTEANRTGGGHERRATDAITNTYTITTNLEQDLLKAVEDGALFLKWMPVVDMASQKIVAHEALLRWNRPDHGEVAPNLFIRHAEEAGMIEALDGWSLRAACREALTWPAEHRVCVNVSPVWLVNERLAALVQDVLLETGLPPERLQIELSEYLSLLRPQRYCLQRVVPRSRTRCAPRDRRFRRRFCVTGTP